YGQELQVGLVHVGQVFLDRDAVDHQILMLVPGLLIVPAVVGGAIDSRGEAFARAQRPVAPVLDDVRRERFAGDGEGLVPVLMAMAREVVGRAHDVTSWSGVRQIARIAALPFMYASRRASFQERVAGAWGV